MKKLVVFLFVTTVFYSCQTAVDYVNQGKLNIATRNYEEAIANLTKATELNPDFPEAYYLRGYLRSMQKNHNGAIADYTKAIELKPDYIIVYCGRGDAKAVLKDYYAAIADYTKAIELTSDYLDAYLNRANSKKKIGTPFCSDYKKACELGDFQSCDSHNADCI